MSLLIRYITAADIQADYDIVIVMGGHGNAKGIYQTG